MASIVSVSRSVLTQRRQMLRRQRRLSTLQSLWQTITVSSLAGGLIWVTTQPISVVRGSGQIFIQGNQRLLPQEIKSMLGLSYPQSLLKIQPEQLARSLESQPPIADATITRQLFPPSLTVHVKERVPVAITLAQNSTGSSTPIAKPSMGLLDESGAFIPLQSYAGQRHLELPQLKVIGNRQQYLPYWTQLYQAMSRTPIKVTEIDCQNPANLILKTELGIVQFGPYSNRFSEQLQALEQMRQISAKIKLNEIAHIDLKNPDNPLVKMNQSEEMSNAPAAQGVGISAKSDWRKPPLGTSRQEE